MTNHYCDLKNADVILIMGSNAAEHHPIAFKWILRAKEKGATIIHVDPRYTRTSARCDFHVPLRSGTDIAFLGGMINYILENNKYFKDYVLNYTNASFIVGQGLLILMMVFSPVMMPKKENTIRQPGCWKKTAREFPNGI